MGDGKRGVTSAVLCDAPTLAAGWREALGVLAVKLDAEEKNAWLAPLRLVSLAPSAVGLSGIDSPFLRERIKNLYIPLLVEALKVGFPQWQVAPPVTLCWGERDAANSGSVETVPKLPASPPPQTHPRTSASLFAGSGQEHPAWLEKLRFDSFIAHEGSQNALSIAMDVCQQQAALWNPLVFYGPPGVGKTHLLYAMRHALSSTLRPAHPEHLMLMSAEHFKLRTLEAIRRRRSHIWQHTLQQVQVLLLDGIENLLISPTSQETLLHCIDTLHAARRQLVLTSTCLPDALPHLSEALYSRLNMGLVLPIHPPNQQGRSQLLHAFFEKERVKIHPEALRYLEEHLAEDVRQIHGAVVRLSAQQRLEAAWSPFSLQQVKTLCQGFLRDRKRQTHLAPLAPQHIMGIICKHFQVQAQDLSSRKRGANITRARRMAIYCLRQFSHLPYQEIAALLGGRSASTVVGASQTQAKMLENQPQTRMELHQLRRLFLGHRT